MRVALLTNAYPPKTRGGAGRVAETQVGLLRAAGHEVKVWLGSLDWISWPAPLRLSLHLMDLVYRFPSIGEIIRWQPDVLITHNLTGCGWSSASLIRAKGIHWVHVLHDVQLFEPSGSLSSADPITLWQKTWSTLRRPVFSQPDLVISPTQWLLDQHRRRGWFEKGRSCILPNPAPEEHNPDLTPHETPRILFVGRFTPDKGSSILRELIEQMDPSFEWHIVGEGQAALAKVAWHGVLDQPSILQLMSTMDVLVIPSQIEENQPNVMLEAAACQLPVLASNKGGIPETLGQAGILVEATKVERWKQQLEYFIHHRHEPHWRAGMQTVWQRSAPAPYLTALEELLKSKRKT